MGVQGWVRRSLGFLALVMLASSVIAQPLQLPVHFNWQDSGKCTPSKQQWENACEIFASVSTLECAWLVEYGIALDLSEMQLRSCPGSSDTTCPAVVAPYPHWLNSYGAVLESEIPNPCDPLLTTGCCPPYASCQESLYTPSAHLLDSRSIPTNRDSVKIALLEKPLLWEKPSHAAVVVGWNDTIRDPESNEIGCWRIKDHYPLANENGFRWEGYSYLDNANFTMFHVRGRVYYVDGTNGSDSTGDGTPQLPFASLSRAVQRVSNGDTILIAPGNYSGAGNRGIILEKWITLAGTSAVPESTVIDCGGQSFGLFVYNQINEGHGAFRMSNLTIRNAYRPDLPNVEEGGSALDITVPDSALIVNCIFENCVTLGTKGGAVSLKASSQSNPVMFVENCTFINNYLGGTTNNYVHGGAALQCDGRTTNVISNCTFKDNVVARPHMGGAAIGFIYQPPGTETTPRTIVRECLFENNRAVDSISYTRRGGAICQNNATWMTVENCTFYNNFADSGSAIYLTTPERAIVRNNIIANHEGIAVYLRNSSYSDSVARNIFHQNASIVGGTISCASLPPSNVVIDPLFCSASSGDFAVESHSYASAANNPFGQVIGAFDVGCNIAVIPPPAFWQPGVDSALASMNFIEIQWYAVEDAQRYEIWIDNLPTFCAPERKDTIAGGGFAAGRTYYTSDFPPNAGWWHYRIRAQVNNVWGLWTESRAFRFGSLPSCPVLFVDNGREFVEENPLLTACMASNYQKVVTDHYLVQSKPNISDGTLRLELRELEDEVTYLRSLELLTVDHSLDSKVSVSPDGKIGLYTNTVPLVSAVDDLGNDVTALVQSVDGKVYDREGAGHLVLVFSSKDQENVEQVLSISSGGKGPCEMGPEVATNGDGLRGNIKIEQLSKAGGWSQTALVPAREELVQQTVHVVSKPGSDGTVQVRLSWDNGYRTDVIEQFIPLEEAPTVRELQAASVAHKSNGSDQAAKLGLPAAEGVQILTKGEVLAFAFEPSPVPDGMQRDYVVRATGRYEPTAMKAALSANGAVVAFDAYPNPFNPSTNISFVLNHATHVNLEIVNVLGQVVATLQTGMLESGNHTFTWDASHNASGIYLYRLTVGDHAITKKLMLLR